MHVGSNSLPQSVAHVRALKGDYFMLLAEAMNECDEVQRRLSNLKRRIDGNARVYQDTRPAEDPQALLHQAIEVSERVCTLNLAIDATTVTTRLPDGTPLSEAMAKRDALDRRLELVTGAADSAADTSRFGRDVAALDVTALRAEADRLAVQRRALDAEIQRINWTTEVTIAA
jgi:hypothetical protein